MKTPGIFTGTFLCLASVIICIPATSRENRTDTPPEAQTDTHTAQGTATKKKEQPSTDQTDATGRLESVKTLLVVKVINPDDARQAIKKQAADMGGYATHLNDSSIALKIPPEKMAMAIDAFASQGIVIQKSIQRQDLTLEVAQLEGKLHSKMEILSKLRGFFSDSNFSATLDIERSMSQLVNEIETVKGRLRYLREQAKWSLIEVHFQFREREKVLYVASPFDWLNRANLDTFLEDF